MGFAYNVEIYGGQENYAQNHPTRKPNLGASSIIVRFCRIMIKILQYISTTIILF